MQVKCIAECSKGHSAILSTFIKVPFVTNIFVFVYFWVSVQDRFYCTYNGWIREQIYLNAPLNKDATNKPGTPFTLPNVSITNRGRSWKKNENAVFAIQHIGNRKVFFKVLSPVTKPFFHTVVVLHYRHHIKMACLVKAGKLSKCSKRINYKSSLVTNFVQTCSFISIATSACIQYGVMIYLIEQDRQIEFETEKVRYVWKTFTVWVKSQGQHTYIYLRTLKTHHPD